MTRVKIGNFWRKIANPDYTFIEGYHCSNAREGRQIPDIRHTHGWGMAAFVNAFTVPAHIAQIGPVEC